MGRGLGAWGWGFGAFGCRAGGGGRGGGGTGRCAGRFQGTTLYCRSGDGGGGLVGASVRPFVTRWRVGDVFAGPIRVPIAFCR